LKKQLDEGNQNHEVVVAVVVVVLVVGDILQKICKVKYAELFSQKS
jgi:hypothetical protein